jgi:GNAT superfamily N-acetyltransferase
MIAISEVTSDEHLAAAAFYRSVDYPGRIQPTDRVFCARDGEEIVGITRLSEEEGELLLRGMFVRTDHQRCGLGTRLLRAAEKQMGTRRCWCLPLDHLLGFYGQIGFHEVALEEAPSFLQERCAKYLKMGYSIAVVRRLPG